MESCTSSHRGVWITQIIRSNPSQSNFVIYTSFNGPMYIRYKELVKNSVSLYFYKMFSFWYFMNYSCASLYHLHTFRHESHTQTYRLALRSQCKRKWVKSLQNGTICCTREPMIWGRVRARYIRHMWDENSE